MDLDTLEKRIASLEQWRASFGGTPVAKEVVLTDEQKAEIYKPIDGVVLTRDQRRTLEPSMTDEQRAAVAKAAEAAKQRRALVAAGKSQEEVDAMSDDDVLKPADDKKD